MEQTLLSEVQSRLDQLRKNEAQIEDIENQIKKKDEAILLFEQNWQTDCNHVFYRVQNLALTPYTYGFHCCLCSTFLYLTDIKRRKEEAPSYIGTVIESIYAGTREKQEDVEEKECFPIPPEYQAEVNRKREELDKLQSEKNALVEELQKLKTSFELSQTELADITHLLMAHFGYPKTVIQEPIHWGPDDFNYDG